MRDGFEARASTLVKWTKTLDKLPILLHNNYGHQCWGPTIQAKVEILRFSDKIGLKIHQNNVASIELLATEEFPDGKAVWAPPNDDDVRPQTWPSGQTTICAQLYNAGAQLMLLSFNAKLYNIAILIIKLPGSFLQIRRRRLSCELEEARGTQAIQSEQSVCEDRVGNVDIGEVKLEKVQGIIALLAWYRLLSVISEDARLLLG
ncbi:hypothetical protein B0J17DRAFT_749098 [Rhizoctonia solani]|nr:hypothetical protein B0J17DRAFT_749098 [Rhizoctonia solani]